LCAEQGIHKQLMQPYKLGLHVVEFKDMILRLC